MKKQSIAAVKYVLGGYLAQVYTDNTMSNESPYLYESARAALLAAKKYVKERVWIS